MTSPRAIRRGIVLFNANLRKLRLCPESAFFPSATDYGTLFINLNILGRCWFLTCTLSLWRATGFYPEHGNFSSCSCWNPGLPMEFRVWILNYFSVLHGFLNGDRISFQPWCSHWKSPYPPPDLTETACSEIITLEQTQGVYHVETGCSPPVYQKDQGRILGTGVMLH